MRRTTDIAAELTNVDQESSAVVPEEPLDCRVDLEESKRQSSKESKEILPNISSYLGHLPWRKCEKVSFAHGWLSPIRVDLQPGVQNFVVVLHRGF